MLRGQLVNDWHDAVNGGEVTLMLARRRADVADLNQRARCELKSSGYLNATTETNTAGMRVCEGDWILARRNNRRIGVHNGDLGVVTRIDEDSLTVQLDRGPTVEIPSDYIAAGHLDYGYALTVHKAQGATCDRSFVLGDESLHQELGYTAMSRGKLRNQLYVMVPDRERDDPGGHASVKDDSFDLVAALRRSEAKELARTIVKERSASIEL